MREQEVPEIKATEPRSESKDRQPEPSTRVAKKRVPDTLTDENPLICRGVD
jgi:hypothetical protein